MFDRQLKSPTDLGNMIDGLLGLSELRKGDLFVAIPLLLVLLAQLCLVLSDHGSNVKIIQ